MTTRRRSSMRRSGTWSTRTRRASRSATATARLATPKSRRSTSAPSSSSRGLGGTSRGAWLNWLPQKAEAPRRPVESRSPVGGVAFAPPICIGRADEKATKPQLRYRRKRREHDSTRDTFHIRPNPPRPAPAPGSAVPRSAGSRYRLQEERERSLPAPRGGTRPAGSAAPLTVGFIYVGPKDDYGYNQAHAEGAKAVAKLPGVKMREEENVPETVDVQKTMESMINLDGAKLLFPTSFGYFDPHILKIGREVPGRHVPPLRRPVHRGQAPEERRQLLRLHRRGPVRGRHRRRAHAPRPTSSASSPPSRSPRCCATSTRSRSARAR